MSENLRKHAYKYIEFESQLGQKRSCPICKNKNYSVWNKFLFFKTVECTKCNMIYLERILKKKYLNKYYQNYTHFRTQNKKKSILRKKMYQVDLNYLSLYKNKGKLIDVGCSNGSFLKLLKNKYNCYGIDVDAKAIIEAKKINKLKNKLFNYDLRSLNNKLGKFDIIVFRGVIEHIENPKDYFKYADKILKKNGIIFISATPNVNSPCAQVFRDKWNQFDPIQHINLFSSHTLSKLAKKFNLELIGEHYPYINTPYENFKVDIKNFLNKEGDSPPFWGSMMTLIFKKI